MNRTLQIALNIVVGVVAFIFFLVLVFPLDAVVGHYLANLESLTKGHYRLVIGEMDASLLFDSEFLDFKLEQKQGENFVEIVEIPKLKVGISLMALLSRSANLHFNAEFKKGEVRGQLVYSPAETMLDLKFDKMALEQLSLVQGMLRGQGFGAELRGTLDGMLAFTQVQRGGLMGSDAQFNLKLSDFRLEDIKINVSGQSFFLPVLVLSPKEGQALIEGELGEGRLSLTNLSLPGPDFELQVSGRLNLNNNFQIARSALTGRFAFSEALLSKVPMLAMISLERKADGYYPFRLAGSSDKPQIRIGNLNISEMLGL